MPKTCSSLSVCGKALLDYIASGLQRDVLLSAGVTAYHSGLQYRDLTGTKLQSSLQGSGVTK